MQNLSADTGPFVLEGNVPALFYKTSRSIQLETTGYVMGPNVLRQSTMNLSMALKRSSAFLSS